MIHDVDESLRALVRRDAVNGSGVDVAFDAPTKEWVARRNSPTVDLYLYDIREDTTRREVMWENVVDASGRVTERRLPPRRFRLSYLITAWTQRPEDEHRLLSAMLSCFVRHEFMPFDLLVGSLEGSDLPVYLTVALPPTEDRSIADVWSAMGGELKPSLDLVVTAPLQVQRSQEVGPPVLEEPFIRVAPAKPGEGNGSAGGRKRSGSRSVSGSRATKGAAAEQETAAVQETPSEPLADETRAAGTKAQPGRTIRVRSLPRRA